MKPITHHLLPNITMRFPFPLPHFILVLLTVVLLLRCAMLWPRYLCQTGISQLKTGNYGQAIRKLEQARRAMPPLVGRWLATSDRFMIYSHQGQAMYHLGIQQWQDNSPTASVIDTLVGAKSLLGKAADIEPEQYINAYYQACTEEGLEKAHAWLYPQKENPYHADPWYQKAMALRPAGITVRYAYIRYLHDQGRSDGLASMMGQIIQMHPASYYNLRKEPFFGPEMIPAVQRGLALALEQPHHRREALKASADFSESAGKLDQAITYCMDYLADTPAINSFHDYNRMGQLILRGESPEKSFPIFKQAISVTNDPDTAIDRIYRLFQKEDRLSAFLQFSRFLTESRLHTVSLDLCVARCWLAMDRPQMAKARLVQLTTKHPQAKAYALLTAIAQDEKDWDQMERWAHQATRLDPEAAHYYHLHSLALTYQGKYAHAEAVEDQAIAHADPANTGYYNHRAWIRWRQEKYDQAAADWQAAFAISPEKGSYPYYIAMAHEKAGHIEKGRASIRLALALEPDNPDYLRLERKLELYR